MYLPYLLEKVIEHPELTVRQWYNKHTYHLKSEKVIDVRNYVKMYYVQICSTCFILTAIIFFLHVKKVVL